MNGFIYVMTNPTVPGLSKVGMTTRDPATRKDELSRATGVASPFTLVYIQPVKNCRAAEVWVHETLELAGFRHADNREFFNAPLHEIVRVVAGAGEIGAEEVVPTDAPIYHDRADYRDGPSLKALGDKYLLGQGVIKNPATALRYYKLALKDLHWEALTPASSVLRGEHGLKADPETELKLISAATDAGQLKFLPMLASLFASKGQFDGKSAQGTWITYFMECLPRIQNLEVEESERSREEALVLRNEAADVALVALEFAIEGKFDTSERGWWQVFYMLADQISDAIEHKYAGLRSELSDARQLALKLQIIGAQCRYVTEAVEGGLKTK